MKDGISYMARVYYKIEILYIIINKLVCLSISSFFSFISNSNERPGYLLKESFQRTTLSSAKLYIQLNNSQPNLEKFMKIF